MADNTVSPVDNAPKQAILSAKSVKVSFSTPSGRVQAVRGIDFDLYKGETLAIVGESGSGKSVTSKAILGLLADNADVERGEIIFDGLDLLKTGEKEFGEIRGEKISMIFQDPLSSLDPIVRIGKQLTEAMLIKGKQKQKKASKELGERLKFLQEYMAGDASAGKSTDLEQHKAIINKFRTFLKAQYKLENAYNYSRQEIYYCIDDIDKLLIRVRAEVFDHIAKDLKRIRNGATLTFNTYLVNKKQQEVLQIMDELDAMVETEVATQRETILQKLDRLKVIMEKTLNRTIPNFFAMAYFVSYAGQPLPEMDTKDLNEYLQKHLDSDFRDDFVAKAKQAVIYSHNRTVRHKQVFVDTIDQKLNAILQEGNGKKATMLQVKELASLVGNCIDRLSNKKDNNAYIFAESFRLEIEHYYKSVKNNTKEQKRYDNQLAKKQAKGDDISSVVPAGLIDLSDIKSNIQGIIARLKTNFERDIVYGKQRNFDLATRYMVDFIKNLSQAAVYNVTPKMAKRTAIRLMEEVGINDAERRFYQFPFEFSGGMRQRIVIAIALSSTPQVLICDEPTTALDVTIQSQILELINDLKTKRELSIIFITHDLGVVANMADRVAVMYAGKVVEIGNKNDIFYNPKHPYTWALLGSMPDMDTEGKLDAIPGVPPNMLFPPKGDAFAARNKYAMKIDFEQQPPMFKVSDSHYAATWLLHPQAPKVDLPKAIQERIERSKAKYGDVFADAASLGGLQQKDFDIAAASSVGDSSTNLSVTQEDTQTVENVFVATQVDNTIIDDTPTVSNDTESVAQDNTQQSAVDVATDNAEVLDDTQQGNASDDDTLIATDITVDTLDSTAQSSKQQPKTVKLKSSMSSKNTTKSRSSFFDRSKSKKNDKNKK